MRKNSVYIAFPEFKDNLLEELKDVTRIEENLIFAKSSDTPPCFAADIWLEPEIITFKSISDAAKILCAKQRHWFSYPLKNFRRAKLIEAQCKNPFKKTIPFSATASYPVTGVFCLLDTNTLLLSKTRWKKIPFGLVTFQEDKVNPPNRAYLKLWEALTLLDIAPKPGETALDLGASPGGWSYVLAELGAKVIAVDKAPLTPTLMKKPNITYLQESAFGLNPQDFKEVDWLLSDIACYPERLYALIMRWLDARKDIRLICTIKLQGKTDMQMIRKFQEIPNGQVIHLFYNKHEATFLYPTTLIL